MLTSNLFLIGLAGAGIALVFAALMVRKVLKQPEGGEDTVRIAKAIRAGANAYLKRQIRTVLIVFVPVFIALFLIAFLPPWIQGAPLLGYNDGYTRLLSPFAPFAFISGGFFTGLSGYIGMKIATRANSRTATATKESLNKGLRVSFSAGAVMGFTVVGLSLLDVTLWFVILRFGFGVANPVTLGNTMIKFGLGVAFMAMFSRVGGGIFTKAADVGADLVGKVEVGIPEDDPRNPAVIADNVGDNVGDVAGMGADLYEAFAHAIIACFALGAGAGFGIASMLLPILICVVGVIASVIGTFFVKTKENATQKGLLKSLHRGTWIAAGITVVLALPITLAMGWIPNESYYGAYSGMAGISGGWIWGIFACVVIGIAAGLLIAFFSEYFTSDTYKPTKELAESTETGSATVMIGGLSLGMKSTVGPVLTVAVAALAAFFASGGVGLGFQAGLYGIAIASVGLVATLGINLATDAFGPVADNAGGIAQMANMDPEVRNRTDALDSLGNTTAATGKGFSIGATAFTAVALLVSYWELTRDSLGAIYVGGGMYESAISLINPMLLVGLFIGAVTAFFFAALTIKAVHKAAQCIVVEVRRQFKEIPGLMDGTGEPDYAKCVDICTRSALRKMIAPSLVALVVPIVVGLLMGPSGVIGMMAGIIVTGFVLAIFMMTSGGAWDNAKKYVEAGNHGGKGSEQHKAAVIGDTVGDPFKDTAGPSFNILITLSSSVALVFAAVAVNTNLLGLIM